MIQWAWQRGRGYRLVPHPDGVQANKSVIMHMLSQVRVGMDLTRIVLPTFILEKRSLLEMYAEFLAHPDLFAAYVAPENLR